MRRIIVVCWIAAACASASCSRQEAGWRHASRDDTIAAYEEYLGRYPAGAHAAAARARLLELRDERDWARADRLATPEAWQRYLGEWPDGRHAALARRRLVEFVPPAGVPPPVVRRTFVAQLGAYSSEAAARADLARILARHAAVLDPVPVQVRSPGAGERPLWRLRAGPLEEDAARALCATLVTAGAGCLAISAGSTTDLP